MSSISNENPEHENEQDEGENPEGDLEEPEHTQAMDTSQPLGETVTKSPETAADPEGGSEDSIELIQSQS